MTRLSLNGARVLVIEDDWIVADALRFLIDGFDGRVTTIAPTVERALEALDATVVDVAVLDINLRGASVVPLAEHLRAERVPFVFLTGYADADVLPDHLRGYPRFAKPVAPEPLVQALVQLLGPLRGS
jgi:CheY-like chemotaxis protein